MNEEIKEIIRKDYEDKLRKEFVDIILELPFSNLLDYITSLQQDIDKANDIIEKDRQFCKCRMDEYAELKKENEFLKLNNPEMNIEHFRIVKENKRKIDNLRKENERLKENNQSYQEEMARTWKIADDYKSRINKAIGRISLLKMDDITIETNKALDYVLKSLNGSDDKRIK